MNTPLPANTRIVVIEDESLPRFTATVNEVLANRIVLRVMSTVNQHNEHVAHILYLEVTPPRPTVEQIYAGKV